MFSRNLATSYVGRTGCCLIRCLPATELFYTPTLKFWIVHSFGIGKFTYSSAHGASLSLNKLVSTYSAKNFTVSGMERIFVTRMVLLACKHIRRNFRVNQTVMTMVFACANIKSTFNLRTLR